MENSVVIIKSARKKQLMNAIYKCRKRFRNSMISVIVQGTFLDEAKEYQADNIICSHKEDCYSLFRIGWRKLISLRKKRYDKIVILYNNPDGSYCSNIDLLAIVLGGEKWIFDNEGRFYRMKSWRWVCHIFPLRTISGICWFFLFLLFLPVIVVLEITSRIFRTNRISFEEQKEFGG